MLGLLASRRHLLIFPTRCQRSQHSVFSMMPYFQDGRD